MKNFEFSIPTRVIVGIGSVNEVKNVVGAYGKKALLVTGRSSMRKTGILDKVNQLVSEGGVELLINEEVDPNPTSTYVNRMADVVKNECCELLIGLGGGSAIDAAKAIAFLAQNEGKMEDYLPGGHHSDMANVSDALPVIAITTTAGTGSEVTMFTVITNTEKKQKPGIGHPSLYPAASIVDAELMTSLPEKITTNTGVDVLFHALEAFISTVATPLTDLLAKEAICLVNENLGDAIHDGNNIVARENMAWANTLAGIAIVQASTVGIHGMGHPIGGHTNAPHGLTMASIGVAFLEATYDADIDRYAELTKILGYNCEGLTKEECASKSPEALKAILEKFNVNISISDLGVTEDIIPQLAKDAFTTMKGCMDVSLKPLTEEDAISIYKNSLRTSEVNC